MGVPTQLAMYKPMKSISKSKPLFASTICVGCAAGYFLYNPSNLPPLPPVLKRRISQKATTTAHPSTEQSQSSSNSTVAYQWLQQFQGAAQHFSLAAISGSVGCAAVYPIDLVKTRMQNQRSVNGTQMYKNTLDCFLKVIKGEGFFGLYRGLGPQLIGVTPEKAMELTVNDLMRGLLLKDDRSYLPFEVIAGACAGASQVLFTNPVEIVKIRLQIQGENIRHGLMKASERQTGLQILRELGVRKLYSGASACLLRDVPFSAIYFSTYPRMKATLTSENRPLSKPGLLVAGAICGVPASAMVTPFDVIKTRLQAKKQKGEVAHTGIRSCASHIWKTEGISAFFKGVGARVCRSSPQFGVTLFVYELLQHRIFPDSQHA